MRFAEAADADVFRFGAISVVARRSLTAESEAGALRAAVVGSLLLSKWPTADACGCHLKRC